MFDLQSLCTKQLQPSWLSTVSPVNAKRLGDNVESTESLWSKRCTFSYPSSHRDVGSIESVQSEQRVTRRGVRTPSLSECTESMDRCNELLPPFLLNGDLDVVSAHHLSPF